MHASLHTGQDFLTFLLIVIIAMGLFLLMLEIFLPNPAFIFAFSYGCIQANFVGRQFGLSSLGPHFF